MFEFFRVWLLILSVAMALAGAVMVLIAGTPLFALVGGILDRPFWSATPDATVRRFQAWAYSVTFATMAGWGLMMAILVPNGFASKQAWVWWSIAGSLALWFPLDTGRSLFHRAYVNALLNTALLVAFAIPLVGTFGEFH